MTETGPGGARRAKLSPDDMLAVLPFILFAVLFLILPLVYLFVQAFQTQDGAFTLDNIAGLFSPKILDAFWYSIRLSAASGGLGALVGLMMALAIIRGGMPNWIGNAVMTFSGVASNFAGIPLAFAFLATLGRLGLVTVLFKAFGINIYVRGGWDLLSFWGLTLTYMYFQIPLMILIIAPAIHGMKKEWNEAAATLGVTRADALFRIVIPSCFPAILAGVRTALGLGVMVIVAAEMLGADSGLGYLIMQARSHFNMANLFVGVIGLGLLSLGLDRLFVVIVDYALPRWSSQRRI